MNHRLLTSACASLVLTGAASTYASNFEQSFGVGAFDLFNVKVSGSFATQPTVLSPGGNKTYIDGFNLPDSSGDLGEGGAGLATRTANWGYSNSSQVDLNAGTIAFHQINARSGTDFAHTLGGTPNVEFNYRIMQHKPGSVTFGLEARAGRISFSYSNSQTLGTTVDEMTDTYQLGGVMPAPAPYAGQFTVTPGDQRIGDTPTRTMGSASATEQGARSFKAKGWLVRGGLVCRALDTSLVSLELHAGPALMAIDESYALNEKILVGSIPYLSEAGKGSRSVTSFGAYGGIAAAFHLAKHWDLTIGLDWLYVGENSVHGGTSTGKFDFSDSILADIAVSYRF